MSDKTTVTHYHQISIFDNRTNELVAELVLTKENVEALRPYLFGVADDDKELLGGDWEIGPPELSFFLGAYANER